MRKFSVVYEETISKEAAVSAETKEEAIAKVKEVVGEDIDVTEVWELFNSKK